MSFKRDGDDKNALNNQRKRRVAELLYEDIDDEEVIRLSNGKYKCKLCSHQPIFDTLNMFYVHKQGKKHKFSMEYAAYQKQELEDLIEKRKHEQQIKAGNTVSNQTERETDSTEGIKKPTFGMKRPRKPYDRKPVLDFDVSPSNKAASSVSMETTPGIQLPGNRLSSFHSTKNPDSYSDNFRTVGKSGSEKISNGKPRSLVTAESKHNGNFKMQYKHQPESRKLSENSFIHAGDIHKLVGQSNAEQNNKYYLSRKKQRQETSSLVTGLDKGLSDSAGNQSTVLPAQTWEFYKDFKGKVPFKMKSMEKPLNKLCSGTEGEEKVQKPDSVAIKPAHTNSSSCTDKKERAEKYLNALGSGWKKDWTGSWVKDEDAEFDSDEEPPDIT